jgi:hypothetical protein
MLVRTKSEMKCGDGWFNLRPRSFFTDAVNSEDRSGTIADEHHSLRVESHSRGDAEVPREGHGFPERSYSINHSFKPAAHKHLAIRTKSDAGGI